MRCPLLPTRTLSTTNCPSANCVLRALTVLANNRTACAGSMTLCTAVLLVHHSARVIVARRARAVRAGECGAQLASRTTIPRLKRAQTAFPSARCPQRTGRSVLHVCLVRVGSASKRTACAGRRIPSQAVVPLVRPVASVPSASPARASRAASRLEGVWITKMQQRSAVRSAALSASRASRCKVGTRVFKLSGSRLVALRCCAWMIAAVHWFHVYSCVCECLYMTLCRQFYCCRSHQT